jgi:hypothetical protein
MKGQSMLHVPVVLPNGKVPPVIVAGWVGPRPILGDPGY